VSGPREVTSANTACTSSGWSRATRSTHCGLTRSRPGIGEPLGDDGDPPGLGLRRSADLPGHARNSTGAGGGLWEGLRQLGDDEDVGDPDPLKSQATQDSGAQQASAQDATRQHTEEVDDQE
jgi:hypothetical protein